MLSSSGLTLASTSPFSAAGGNGIWRLLLSGFGFGVVLVVVVLELVVAGVVLFGDTGKYGIFEHSIQSNFVLKSTESYLSLWTW